MQFSFSRELVFFLVVSLFCFFVIYPFLLYFIIGISLAYFFEPLVEKITDIFKLEKQRWRWILSISVILVTLLAVMGPVLTLVTTGIQELIGVLNMLETELKEPKFIDDVARNTSSWLDKFSIHYSTEELIAKGTDFIKKAATLLASGAGTAITATPVFIVKIFVMILTWCFFIVHGKSYRQSFLPKIIPWEKERDVIARTVSSVLKALIVANVLVSCIQAILITTTLALFGIPRFALMGIIAFFISFIPVIGTAPVMIGAAAWCYFSEGRLGAAIGILICAVFVSLADNVLRPFFMKGGAELNFFWIFLAIVGGMSQFGVAGAVLGPVCFALFVAAIKALDEARREPIEEHEAPNP